MNDETNKEILKELRNLNEKIDHLIAAKGLSAPLKLLAVFIGFAVIGPIVVVILSALLNLF
ncbi:MULTISPECIES: hypothetical protein [unclassified Paenibacillus]|uniref:hypothetical protein n=1 Tax=unclassified Paenibacillus TaxID=185978 RepID=UPI00020D72F9|nr:MULTISPECIES: hypothetical protein [unclassified Paenibacillus]EGL15091.1 hypothetical protein HMPREF9413_2298 [Paenibacillus sp. HGF7]EPD93562.1 hypothetical protein HMPREF1207_00128 [Paenibacillus sp. HGH0039]